MSEIGAGTRRRMLLRSFAVQGSWNYQTLIGTGMAFVLAPALRDVHGANPRALAAATGRHAELFNSHPYLATIAAGAIARLEADGVPVETQTRFKSAMRGSLGTMGDRLVWAVWRPACALLGVALVAAGAAWWAGALAFLIAHNALHLWLRAWGLRVGLRDGLMVAKALRESPLQRLGERGADAGAALAGFAAVVLAGDAAAGPSELAMGAAAVAAGLLLRKHVRTAIAAALLAVTLAGILLARTP
ncbi:MAG TPA: PTS system mannose/fructose/sorbose family transporter subunit IID [Longimicrobium sp.]